MTTLAERLGRPPGARLLIVSCDELGASHASNAGVDQALHGGIGTAAGLMVPCPWARDAADRHRGEDVGVLLTLNATHDRYRWAPITHSPSLLDGDGGFPRTLPDVWDHADVVEVRRELRAQVERAIWWGFDVTHLAPHLATLLLRPEFFDVYLELAVDFRLPVRLGTPHDEGVAGFPLRSLAADEGVCFPDDVVELPADRPPLDGLGAVVDELEPGVTELVLRPALDTPELRDLHGDADVHVAHLTLATDPAAAELLAASGVELVGYRALRALQRGDVLAAG